MKIQKTYVTIIFLIFLFTGSLQAQATYESAVKNYKNKKWAATIEEIRQLHEGGGNSYYSHALCGFAYNHIGDFKSASSHFLQALKFKPEDPRVSADLIRLHINHNRTKSGMELATSTIAKFPNDKEIEFLYAMLLFLNGNPKEALNRVEKLKSISHDDPELLNLEGKIYYKLNNFDKAQLSLKWAMTLKNDSPSIWNNLALVQEELYLFYERSGNMNNAKIYLQEAKESIQKAISLDAKNQSIAINAERIFSY